MVGKNCKCNTLAVAALFTYSRRRGAIRYKSLKQDGGEHIVYRASFGTQLQF